MNNFLKNRKSVRDFKDKKLDKKTIQKVKEYCQQLENEKSKGDFRFVLYEDGQKVFDALEGVGGYSGVMIESPHYIGLNFKDNKKESIIYGAYYMEKLITELTNLNIGSCWISLKDVDEKSKKELLGIKEGNIKYLLSIGYPIAKNPFVAEPTSSRLSIEDIVFKDEIGKVANIDELESRGLDDLFYYIRFAPSSYNKQPWRFVLKDHKVILLMAYSNDEEINLVDAGIIMYYFENLAKAIGINSKWKLIEVPDYKNEMCKYKYIGEFRI